MTGRNAALTAAAIAAVISLAEPATAQWYLRGLDDRPILEIRGETADTTALGTDRYVEDNLDHVLRRHEWVIVNFSAYWCPDSDRYNSHYARAAVQEEFAAIRWCCADVDGVRGNENFRERFALPGVPTTILFHNGMVASAADNSTAVLDGHEGDKGYDDLIELLLRFYITSEVREPDR
ncbi:MAG TPA: thioredoxin domain-containing protein [candidate division Zixibacteria bacterium]|jgi:thiol:disulfide interchange protein